MAAYMLCSYQTVIVFMTKKNNKKKKTTTTKNKKKSKKKKKKKKNNNNKKTWNYRIVRWGQHKCHIRNYRCCYDRSLLPSIICLGRLRIASKYIYNLWQLRQRVDSLAQWLEHWIFNREDRVRFPGKTEYFFSYASFLCYGFHVVRWGLVRDWTLYAENGFTSS